MKTLTLKETTTHYIVEVDRAALAQETTLLEPNGAPVAVLISLDDYAAFRAWQRQRTSAAVVPDDFKREVAAFEQLRPILAEQYAGQAVAIYQGRVVAAGDDKMAVLGKVLETLGPVPCYIEWVEADAPRTARVASAWVAR